MQKLIADIIKKGYINKSLIHNSVEKEDKNFQRLEFLGDKILTSKISIMLFQFFVFADEKILSQSYQRIVSNKNLASLAKKLNIQNYIKCTGKVTEGILSDTMEAIIGELYINKRENELQKIFSWMIYTTVFENARVL